MSHNSALSSPSPTRRKARSLFATLATSGSCPSCRPPWPRGPCQRPGRLVSSLAHALDQPAAMTTTGHQINGRIYIRSVEHGR